MNGAGAMFVEGDLCAPSGHVRMPVEEGEVMGRTDLEEAVRGTIGNLATRVQALPRRGARACINFQR